MAGFYDDNFGFWDGMDDPEMREFYQQVQEESVDKRCEGCGRMVRLRPDYAYCNTCADAIEQGRDF